MTKSNLPAWDLTDLYSGIDDPQVAKDLEQYNKLNQKLADGYKGKIAKLEPKDFLAAVKLYEQAGIVASKLGIFAYLNMVTQMNNQKAVAFYAQFVKGNLHRTNSRTAEMCKLTENSSRDVQIAFANELSLICDKAGINVWELIELANKHPRVHILQPGCGVGGHCIAVDPYFITADFPVESQLIAKSREINNYKSFWCAEKIKNAVLEFELKNKRKPIVAIMGLAFKPNIDDLRESPAKYIAQKVMQMELDGLLIVEPNIAEHPVFKLTDYLVAYEKADIVAFLVAHNEFKTLPWRDDKVILDFCGIFKR